MDQHEQWIADIKVALQKQDSERLIVLIKDAVRVY